MFAKSSTKDEIPSLSMRPNLVHTQKNITPPLIMGQFDNDTDLVAVPLNRYITSVWRVEEEW